MVKKSTSGLKDNYTNLWNKTLLRAINQYKVFRAVGCTKVGEFVRSPSDVACVFCYLRNYTLMSQNKDRRKFVVALHIYSSMLSLRSWQSYRLRAFEAETAIALSDQLCKYAAAGLTVV